MNFSPRVSVAASTASRTDKASSGSLRHKLFPWLCRSGRHFWLTAVDREKCCNGWRRCFAYAGAPGGKLRSLGYWRPLWPGDIAFSWETLLPARERQAITAREIANDAANTRSKLSRALEKAKGSRRAL